MKTYTILIADDSPDNILIIVEALLCTDILHKIIKAENGRILCELAEKHCPDLIITDWEMPEMNGIEAIKKIRSSESTKDIPIIMCSGVMTSSENFRMALEGGAFDFIRKPINIIELKARVHSMLNLGESYKIIKEQNSVLEGQKSEIQAQKSELEAANQELEKQYALINIKNNQINCSIKYAQTIQAAILPQKSIIDIIGENFIYYQPKDIVSGDFYWYSEMNVVKKSSEENPEGISDHPSDELFHFLVVGDCTGHGVPGALMSMIANTLLNEIIVNMKVYSPSLALQYLQQKVQTTLHQADSNNDDGMDISICRFEKKSEETIITYAGAIQSLYYYSYSESTMNIVKGNRISIGGFYFDDYLNFFESTVHLKSNDSVYLFTDGMVNQFNEKGAKLGTLNFLKILEENIHLPMSEQKLEIESTCKKLNQLDDITVVGIKIK